jgi:hypothetical protein
MDRQLDLGLYTSSDMRSGLTILFSSAVILSACTQPVLEPTEVIRRSLFVGSTTDSYAFSAHAVATVRGPVVYSGSAVLEGSVKRAGVSASTLSIAMERIQGTATDRIDGVVNVRVPGNGIVYLNLVGVTGAMGSAMQTAFASFTTDGWTQFSMTGTTAASLAPTEGQIAVQAAAFVVQSDRTASRGSTYIYDVRFAPGVLSALIKGARDDAITGTLMINRRTFALERAVWTMVGVPSPMGNITGTADVTFSHFNAAELPVMPLFTGSTLPLHTLFDTISASVPISS